KMVIVSGSFVVGALNALVGLAITLFLLFFSLRAGAAIVGTAVRLVPMSHERRDHLMDHVGAVIRAVVFGSLLTALVQGVLVAARFAIVGLAWSRRLSPWWGWHARWCSAPSRGSPR